MSESGTGKKYDGMMRTNGGVRVVMLREDWAVIDTAVREITRGTTAGLRIQAVASALQTAALQVTGLARQEFVDYHGIVPVYLLQAASIVADTPTRTALLDAMVLGSEAEFLAEVTADERQAVRDSQVSGPDEQEAPGLDRPEAG